MTDMNRVTGTPPGRVDPGRVETKTQVTRRGPRVDTGTVDAAAAPAQLPPPMPPASRTIDYSLANSGMQAMGDYVGVDFGRIAALMMQIDSELARAARDSQVQQIESVADQLHASADDIRESAKMALAGGVVSGGAQIGAAMVNIGGGIKGMQLTSSMAAAETQVPVTEPVSGTAGEPAATTQVPEETNTPASESPEPSAPSLQEANLPETGQPTAGETQAGQMREETTEETVKEVSTSKQKAAAQRLDHTLSQRLSARSHNVALFSQGMAQMATATGEIVKGAMDYESRQKDADSKQADARAEELRAYLDRTKGFADSMQKGAHDMLGIYQQMEDSLHQTHKQIWSRA